MKLIISVYRWLIVICVSGALGAVTNVVLFFTVAFFFAGADGDSWVRWYFGHGGIVFLFVTLLFTLGAFPFVKRLRIHGSSGTKAQG